MPSPWLSIRHLWLHKRQLRVASLQAPLAPVLQAPEAVLVVVAGVVQEEEVVGCNRMDLAQFVTGKIISMVRMKLDGTFHDSTSTSL
jgi:hypothetical protein